MSRLAKRKRIKNRNDKVKQVLNQCSGCKQGLSIKIGETSRAKIHYLNDEPYMVCTKDLY